MPGPVRPPFATRATPVARIVVAIGFAVFLLLLAGICLYLFDADRGNAIVELVLDVAGWLGGPFEGLFDADEDKTQVVYDWGVAAVVWALAAFVVAALIDWVARRGRPKASPRS